MPAAIRHEVADRALRYSSPLSQRCLGVAARLHEAADVVCNRYHWVYFRHSFSVSTALRILVLVE